MKAAILIVLILFCTITFYNCKNKEKAHSEFYKNVVERIREDSVEREQLYRHLQHEADMVKLLIRLNYSRDSAYKQVHKETLESYNKNTIPLPEWFVDHLATCDSIRRRTDSLIDAIK
jgi:hypothetical protein